MAKTLQTERSIRSPKRVLILLVSAVLCLLTAIGQTAERTPRIGIPEAFGGSIHIGNRMTFVKDSDHQLTIVSVLNSALNWSPIDRSSPNFGFTGAAYWFRIEIDNQSAHPQEALLELPIPFLDHIDLFQVRRGVIINNYSLGDSLPFAQRPLQHPNFVMPLTLDAGTNELFLRIASSGTVEAPLTLWNTHDFLQSSANTHMLEGLWCGIILIMAIYNLMLFFSIREQGYLYYAGFAFSYLMFQVSLSGYGFAYLWPNSIGWNYHAIPTMIALSLLMTALLSISFLNLRQTNPWGFRLFAGFGLFSALMAAASFVLPYSITIRATSLVTIIMCVLTPTMSYISWFRGDQYARYFCVGWSAAFFGICLLGLNKFGLLPVTFVTNNAGHIGIALMMVLLSLALADRFNRERKMRMSAQEAALRSEKRLRQSQEELLATKEEANQQLELKVRERTQTLQKALLELEQANNRLELLSTTDALTTLFNRAYFESRVDIEFRRAMRHQRDLSIVLCDVDWFKQINDGHGHKIGDQCLRSFALTLKNKIVRSGDLIARYGGEEFIIMLVDTPLREAEFITNALCEEIRNTPLQTENSVIRVTASFGVASLKQSNAQTAEDLIHRADMAMYQSKNTGRDRVTLWHKIKEQTL